MLSNTISNKDPVTLLAQDNTLAALSFSQSAEKNITALKLSALQVNAEQSNNIVEVWKTDTPIIDSGMTNNCQWRCSDNYLFVSVSLACANSDDLQAVSEQAYQMVVQTIQDSDYQNLLRFWNIIPRINFGAGDNESYKRFCTGRLAAFNQFSVQEEDYPAASAVGHYGDGITVYAIASKLTPEHIGNPRQVDAFNYPRQYGPTSPSFARATSIAVTDKESLFFISGTASILGHNTVHVDDLVGQLHTTNDNILYLLKEAAFKRNDIRSLRVYLRNPDDFIQTKQIVESWYPNADVIITHADICRADLLVEIECFCQSTSS